MRLLLFLLLVSPVFAFPSLLSLDGYLTNSSGAALNGSYSFVFALYNVSSGGSALWTESQTIAVSSGKLNALLGSVTALSLPFDQDYYLGVKVSTDSEMSPRYRIASSAYAYTAKNLAQGASATGGLRLANETAACTSENAGTMRWTGSELELCKGNSWRLIRTPITATGGTITTVGSYRIHIFTANGTFTPDASGLVDVLVVAGGGGGAAHHGGGGGGGGLVYVSSYSVSAQAYPVVVGAGGSGGIQASGPTVVGGNGANSSFGALVAVGGGGGASYNLVADGASGGSGGGGRSSATGTRLGGSGTSGQGYAGGTGHSQDSPFDAGGGGGAGGPGGNGAANVAGNGGSGLAVSISGSAVYYAGGGGGGGDGTAGTGGLGGGGNGVTAGGIGANGVANTGGGGGGTRSAPPAGSGGGAGGSGIVIIRYLI